MHNVALEIENTALLLVLVPQPQRTNGTSD
jgi:hypothetical protein